jgi:DNA-binding MurR/RpiR family transcriptional regulator
VEQNYELIERMGAMRRLSKGQRRICDYILEHYDKAAFMTAAKLGEATGVSESTIVRFAIAMGYEGYPQLQQGIQEMVRNRLTNVQRMEISPDMDVRQLVNAIFKSDMTNIRELYENIDMDTFAKVKQTLLSARRIYVIGLRAASPIAQFFGYYLNYIFDNIHLITQGGSEVREQLARVQSGDVIFGMSFPRYSNRTIESMRFAKSLGATTISITDSASSPLKQLSDLCLIAHSNMASFVDSMVAPLSLLNALIVALSLEKKEEVSRYFEKLEIIWDDTAIYGGSHRK